LEKLLLLGEDFGFFTQQYPGAMFGLGSGITTPALHNQTTIFLMTLSVRGFPFFHQSAKKLRMH
jgi:metal-dependent amidase/aminoacylase/carboxypeptidase family protein